MCFVGSGLEGILSQPWVVSALWQHGLMAAATKWFFRYEMKMLHLITQLVVLCSVGTHNAMLSYTHANIRRHRVAYFPRGGSSIDNRTDSPIEDDDRVLIGVLDLRPTPGPDSILVLKRIMHGQLANDVELEAVQQARFPLSQDHDELSVTEEELNEQAASSNCIGNLCTTVYLIIEYDFDNGKTVLHRTFGGVKLMAFVDGVRSRWHEFQSSRITKLDERNGAAAKLIALLVPSSQISSSSESRIDFDSGCDVAGVTFLINRLNEAFALGGDEFQSVKPFEVQYGIVHKCEENDEDLERQIKAIFKWRTATSQLNALSCTISNAYRNAGGNGIIEYQTQQT